MKHYKEVCLLKAPESGYVSRTEARMAGKLLRKRFSCKLAF